MRSSENFLSMTRFKSGTRISFTHSGRENLCKFRLFFPLYSSRKILNIFLCRTCNFSVITRHEPDNVVSFGINRRNCLRTTFTVTCYYYYSAVSINGNYTDKCLYDLCGSYELFKVKVCPVSNVPHP